LSQFSLAHVFGRRLAATILGTLSLGVALSACGSSSSPAKASASTTGAQFQARLNLAKCYRAHGLNVPDPSTGGGPAGGGGFFRQLRNYPQAQVQAAQTACSKYFTQAFPQLNLSPAQRAQAQQQLVKFAECMRSHGVNIPDPTFNSSGGFGLRRLFGSVDRNSPAFQAGLKACQSVRPRFGRGGGGGGAGGGPGGGPPAGGTPGA
jgi:hypothetical protein